MGTEKIKQKKNDLKEAIAYLQMKIDYCPNVSFDRPKYIQDINLLKGKLKGIKFAEKQLNSNWWKMVLSERKFCMGKGNVELDNQLILVRDVKNSIRGIKDKIIENDIYTADEIFRIINEEIGRDLI